MAPGPRPCRRAQRRRPGSLLPAVPNGSVGPVPRPGPGRGPGIPARQVLLFGCHTLHCHQLPVSARMRRAVAPPLPPPIPERPGRQGLRRASRRAPARGRTHCRLGTACPAWHAWATQPPSPTSSRPPCRRLPLHPGGGPGAQRPGAQATLDPSRAHAASATGSSARLRRPAAIRLLACCRHGNSGE